MAPRSRGLNAILVGLGLALAQPAKAQTCLTEGAAWGAELAPSVRMNWRFRAASPIAGVPSITSDGQVYLATHEGYIHSISPAGAFLWSYTVAGALLHGLAVGPSRRAYVSSSRGVVYAINPSGQPHWVFHSPVRFDSALTISPSKVIFGVSGLQLYALSTRRGLLWRALLRARTLTGPLTDQAGRAWLVTSDNQLHRVRKPFDHRKTELEAADSHLLIGVSSSGVLVQSDDRLQALDPAGQVRWSYGAVLKAGRAEGGGAVAWTGDALVLIDEQGKTLRRWPLSSPLSAPPVSHGAWTAAPGASGILRLYNGKTVTACRVSSAPLLSPVMRGSTLWVAAGDGTVATFQLDPEEVSSGSVETAVH